jgi:hypothetical protein
VGYYYIVNLLRRLSLLIGYDSFGFTYMLFLITIAKILGAIEGAHTLLSISDFVLDTTFNLYPVNGGRGRGSLTPQVHLFTATSEPLEMESNALVKLLRNGWTMKWHYLD